jgi:hypothetical protein
MAVKGLKVGSLNTSDDVSGLVKVVPTSVAVGSGSGSSDSLGNVTFSGASSVSLNGCFISTYQNYRIVASNLQGVNGTALNLRLRASGSDTSTGYYGSNIYMLFTSTAVNGGATNNASNIGISSVVNTADTPSFLTFEVGHPRDLKQVHVIANSFQADSYVSLGAWKQQNSSALTYDGFTLYPGAGTISGTIRVYGYNQ